MATISLSEAQQITAAREQQHGLPSGTLLKIAGIESSYNRDALSPKGARGYFQFMPETGRSYGLEKDEDYADFHKSSDAAGRYMADLVKQYGGHLDLALAHYNGGGKAAKALAAGKPWAETSDYLAKFYKDGSGPTQVAPQAAPSQLSKQFTTGDSASPSYGGPSPSELVRDEAQRAAQYDGVLNTASNLPRALSLGFQQENSVYNWWQERGLEQFDPEFKWSEDISKQMLADIPQQHWGYVLQAGSMKEATARRSRIMDSIEKQTELAKMGTGLALTGGLTGALVDLPTLIAFVPGAGGAGMLSRSSRLANAVRSGLAGAASNVAYDAVANKYKPLATTDDLYISAAMGLALGAVGGLSVNPKRLAMADEAAALRDFGMRESVKAQHAELREHGIEPPPVTKNVTSRKGEVEDPAVVQVREEVSTFRNNTVDSGLPKFPPTEGARARLESLKGSDDPMVSSLAGRLSEQLRDDVRVELMPAGKRAHYDPTSHTVRLSRDSDDWVALHEISHAATHNKIRFGRDNPTSTHGQLVKELEGVFGEVKRAAKGQAFGDHKTKYYLKNLDEFVAGIYSGKSEFIDFLAKTRVSAGGQSILSKAVDTIRKILGMPPSETNALTKALGLTDKLIDEPLKVEQGVVSAATGETKKLQFLMSPGVDEATAKAASDAEISTVFGWGLGLENRLGGAKAPSAVRQLASKLFGTTVGYKDHSVVKANAWDDTTKWADAWAVEMRKGTYPAFEEWFKGGQYKWHEKGKAFDDFGQQVSNYIRGFDGDYPPQVIKAGDHMRKTLAKVVDYINNPHLDEGGKKLGLTESELRDPETGAVEVVGTLEKNPKYLPRKHDINKWNDMVVAYGRDAVEGWWARAYQAGREGVSEEAAQRWAKWYMRTVEEAHANRSHDLLESLLQGTDKDALKHSLMTNGGFTEAEAWKVVDDMIPTRPTDSGRQSSLKHRNTILETFSETWTRADGTKMEVTLNDFVQSNAFDVVEPYLRRMAGSVALAKHLDVYKAGDVNKAIADATVNKLGSEALSQADLAKYRKDLQFAFERIQGLPQEDFTVLNKSMEMWRNFNVIRLMGGAVWNQASELSQIVGTMGWKATLRAIPELRALRRDIATGKAPNDILDHLENTIGGAGSEYVSRIEFKASDDWVRQRGDTAFNRKLDALDTGLKKMAKGVLDYTGMTPLMVQQKRVHAVALVNHFVSAAQDGKPSSFMTPDRLAWMGLDDASTKKLLEGLKAHSKPTKGEYAGTFKVDFEGWQKADPESYSRFMTAIHRESRRVVQENDLASMVPLMGTTLGKTVFQFMNFSMHGWNKSLMFAMNHRDWTTLSTVLHGGFLASLSYMGRTMLGSVGMDSEKRQEYLDQRMNAGQIVRNSFGRIAQASLLPNVYDTLSPYPMFSGMRTTSDLSSLASNPTYQAINGLISMKKLVRNGLSDEYQTTAKDVRDWARLMPLNNVVPVSTLLNAIANDYPGSEQQ